MKNRISKGICNGFMRKDHSDNDTGILNRNGMFNSRGNNAKVSCIQSLIFAGYIMNTHSLHYIECFKKIMAMPKHWSETIMLTHADCSSFRIVLNG